MESDSRTFRCINRGIVWEEALAIHFEIADRKPNSCGKSSYFNDLEVREHSLKLEALKEGRNLDTRRVKVFSHIPAS